MLHEDNVQKALQALGDGEDLDKVNDLADPWVVVGTTTIDGTLMQVGAILDVAPWPLCTNDEAEKAVDLFMRSTDPWLVGGRHLRPKSSHINSHGDVATAVIRCDVVRRQTEIDAEMLATIAPACNEIAAAMRAADPCPECGPHGNDGRVLLLESWVGCTTCREGRDPPGVLVTGRDDLQVASWFAEGLPDHATGFSSRASARIDAWNWHDRRP